MIKPEGVLGPWRSAFHMPLCCNLGFWVLIDVYVFILFWSLVMVPVCVMLPLPSCFHAIGSLVHCVMFWLVVLVMCPVSHWLVLVMWLVLFAISSHCLSSSIDIVTCCRWVKSVQAKPSLFIPSQVSVRIMFVFWITFCKYIALGFLNLPPVDCPLQTFVFFSIH